MRQFIIPQIQSVYIMFDFKKFVVYHGWPLKFSSGGHSPHSAKLEEQLAGHLSSAIHSCEVSCNTVLTALSSRKKE